MIVFALLAALFVFNSLNIFTGKCCSRLLAGKGLTGTAFFVFINGIGSCCVFFAFTGFVLEINTACVLLSVLYALVCAAAQTVGFIIYRYAEVSNVNVGKSSLSLIFTALVGFAFFKEAVEPLKLVRIGVMLLAAFCVFLDCRPQGAFLKDREKNSYDKSRLVRFSLALAVLVVIACYSTVQAKILASTSIVPDMNSYFFMTNLVMVVGSAVLLTAIALADRENFSKQLRILNVRSVATMLSNTVSSNVSTVLGVLILKHMEVSVYTPVNSALSILCGALVSVFFREQLGKFAWISVVLAVIAVII